ncbi:hypothetical protein C356_01600 [Cryptococcus neoformans c45]|nr:hypothetical protein C356_01600 [Cryptococcus neoformans var. grubii c45]
MADSNITTPSAASTYFPPSEAMKRELSVATSLQGFLLQPSRQSPYSAYPSSANAPSTAASKTSPEETTTKATSTNPWDELSEGELADRENMKLPKPRRRRKNEADEIPKRSGERSTSTPPSGTLRYYALEWVQANDGKR